MNSKILELIYLSIRYNWDLLDFQFNIKMISFQRGTVRINVYLTTMTVGTRIDHPKKGKTQMFRKKVDMATMRKIFENPRVHTDKGYHIKGTVTGRWSAKAPNTSNMEETPRDAK